MSLQSENRLNGLTAQERVRKILGIEPKFRGRRGNEEAWPESPYLPGFRFEVKRWTKLPARLKNAIQQVHNTRAVGSVWSEAAVIVDAETERVYLFADLEDVVNTCRALAEVGQGSKIKGLARDGEQIMRAIREAAS